MIAALVVLGCGMSGFGSWVSDRIEKGLIQTTANGAALYITSMVAPHAQTLQSPGTAKETSFRALDALLTDTILGQKVLTIKIWDPAGTIVYSSNREIVGQKYPVSENLKKAFKGEVVAEFDTLGDEGDEFERMLGIPLLEIYTPIRKLGSSEVIAVGEIYEDARPLEQSLRETRLRSWSIVGLVTLGMLTVLFGIIRKGSSTIAQQQQALRDRIGDLFQLLAQNKELRDRIDDLLHRAVETNDLVLRRVGSELHDGPAQLISLALLRLDALNPQLLEQGFKPKADDYDKIRSALADSLTEIRNLSAGLALPELNPLSPADAIRIAVMGHERRTGTTVACNVDGLPQHLPNSIKACLYRVTQEALNNAFRHAGGVRQAVQGICEAGMVGLIVSDHGPGFQQGGSSLRKGGLGIQGMRDRVSSLGGTFEIQSAPTEGTRLTASFKLDDDGTGQGWA